MDQISIKDVEHIAGLARIKLGEREKEKMARELGAIFGYIDKLKEVNTEGVEEAIAHITGMENVLRKDEAMKKPLAEQAVEATNLVEMAPDSKDGFVKVPAVFRE